MAGLGDVLHERGIAATARAEELAPDDFIALTQKIIDLRRE